MKQSAILTVAVLAGVMLVAVLVQVLFTGSGEIPSSSRELVTLDKRERSELIKAGAYVARAADCIACHVSQDGLSLAGGTPMKTPMGTLYGTNITPSETHGIGNYDADDLYRVMVYGIAPGGRNLYPAMPYVSYHAISREDNDALWIWLMAQNSVDRPNRPNELTFPFNWRPLLGFWNLLFRPEPPEQPTAGLTGAGDWSETERGRYLVDVLGHCGECHTPRNLLYAKTDAHLGGAVIEQALAPDITAEGLATRGWNKNDLAQFLSTGLAPQGVMTFRMFPVLSHSTKYLDRQEIGAIVTYLTDDMPAGSAPEEDASARLEMPEAHRLYLGLCAGCHGSDGNGQPHGSVPMKGNTTLMMQDPLNLVRVILEGIEARALSGYERMQEMPGFADRIEPDELARLASYLRRRWGGQSDPVQTDAIEELSKLSH